MIQSNLNFTEPKPKPKNASQELNTLLAYLRGKTEWTPCKEIIDAFGFSRRKIRSLVEDSDFFIISGPGSPGYKHRLDCTTEEIKLASSKSISQGKKMIRKGIGMLRGGHDDLNNHPHKA